MHPAKWSRISPKLLLHNARVHMMAAARRSGKTISFAAANGCEVIIIGPSREALELLDRLNAPRDTLKQP